MKYIKTENTELLNNLRKELYQNLKAPIDAMWEMLYIGSSQHYIIEDKNLNIGFFCIDENKSLVQFFLNEENKSKPDKIISSLIEEEMIRSAKLSSNEPVSFNACLFHSKSIKTNTFCFQHSNKPVNIENRIEFKTCFGKGYSRN